MQAILIITSVLLLSFVFWDVFKTIFSTRGGGPLSNSWTRLLWECLLIVHKWRPVHRLLTYAGPFMLLSSILLWYILLGVGVFIAFAAYPDSVINNSTGELVDLHKKAYFVSSIISSLGYGDLVPSKYPWTIIASLATLAATVILTISLSYVLSVLLAAIERRKLAQAVFGLGTNISELINTMKLDSDKDSLKTHIISLSSHIDAHTFKHFIYPILNFFHNPNPTASSPRAILLLSDTFFVLEQLPADIQPPPGIMRLVHSSITNYAESLKSSIVGPEGNSNDPPNIMEAAHTMGISIDNPDFKGRLNKYMSLRRYLVALCKEDGWDEY
ncbi:MAG: hypothetical protein ACOCX0_05460 [Bacteroidota bacterium]